MSHTVALIILCLIGPIFGYLSGSLLWSVIISKFFFEKDIRQFESRNAGATNSSRVLGKKAGVCILFLDVLKCYIPTMLMWMIATYGIGTAYWNISNQFSEFSLVYLTGTFAIVGHCWPVFFKFKGGKGVSCFGGLMIAINPFLALIGIVIFAVIIKIWKWVSFSSVITSFLLILIFLIPGFNWMYMTNQSINHINYASYPVNGLTILFVISIIFFGASIILYKHLGNMRRVIIGIERKVGVKRFTIK